MTWERTYSTTVSGVTRADIWNTWADVNNWHRWDSDIEYARMDGPFEAGQSFLLKPKGGPRVRIQFEHVQRLASYTDLTHFPLARMWGIHEMRDTEHGLELSCRIRVTGPLAFLWRKLVAEGVVKGLEQQTRQLVAYAQEQGHHASASHEGAIGTTTRALTV